MLDALDDDRALLEVLLGALEEESEERELVDDPLAESAPAVLLTPPPPAPSAFRSLGEVGDPPHPATTPPAVTIDAPPERRIRKSRRLEATRSGNSGFNSLT